MLNSINRGCERLEKVLNIVDNVPIVGIKGSMLRIAFGATQIALGILAIQGGLVAGTAAYVFGKDHAGNAGFELARFGFEHVIQGVLNEFVASSEIAMQFTTLGTGNLLMLLIRSKRDFKPFIGYNQNYGSIAPRIVIRLPFPVPANNFIYSS